MNKLYFEHRVMNHAEGSLEALIQKSLDSKLESFLACAKADEELGRAMAPLKLKPLRSNAVTLPACSSGRPWTPANSRLLLCLE